MGFSTGRDVGPSPDDRMICGAGVSGCNGEMRTALYLLLARDVEARKYSANARLRIDG
jgi:hypothetical protein